MTLADRTDATPERLAALLERFDRLGREDRMQALVSWSRRLPPLPERFATLDREAFTVPECQTRVDLFPERRDDGTLWFHVDVNARQSPTVAAFLAILLDAVSGRPPEATLAIPDDVVPRMMRGLGLAARETGLAAMVRRLKRHAAALPRVESPAPEPSPPSQAPA